MPDRAVVDGQCCESPKLHSWINDEDETQIYCRNCNQIFPHEPRAVVAISEDRQWLVVPQASDIDWFLVMELDRDRTGYHEYDSIPDTGQDAHEVLAAWMEGRQ